MQMIRSSFAIGAVVALCGCGSGGGDEAVSDAEASPEPEVDILAGEPAAGEWGHHTGSWDYFGTSTYFGEDYRNTELRFGCGRDPYQLVLLRDMAEPPAEGVTVRVLTADGEHEYSGGPAVQNVPMVGVPSAVEVRMDLDDPAADHIADSEGAWAVVIGDTEPLVVPSGGDDIRNMVDWCRNAAEPAA